MTPDKWHLTCDTWHVTCDMWHMVGGWTFSQNVSSLAQLNELINHLMKKGVCRTARATLGLLITWSSGPKWPNFQNTNKCLGLLCLEAHWSISFKYAMLDICAVHWWNCINNCTTFDSTKDCKHKVWSSGSAGTYWLLPHQSQHTTGSQTHSS